MEKYENLKNYLLSNEEELTSIVSDINCIDGSLDYLEYWDNDEEFFDTFFPNNPTEAVRAACYGDYNYCDDFVRFNGYGNLESFDDWELEKEYGENIDEIINCLVEHYGEIDITEDLNGLLVEYIEEVKIIK